MTAERQVRYLRGALRGIPQELSATDAVSHRVLYMKTKERHREGTRGTHLDGRRRFRVMARRCRCVPDDRLWSSIIISSRAKLGLSTKVMWKLQRHILPQPTVRRMNSPTGFLTDSPSPRARPLFKKAHRKSPQNSRPAKPHEARGSSRCRPPARRRPHDPGHSKPPSSRILALHPSVPSQSAICSRTYTLVSCSSAAC